MKHIVSYSGGIGSAMTAQLLCEEYGKENVALLFADTNMEDEDLYRFNSDLVNKLKCEFIRIADGRTVWEVFEDVKFIGNSRIDPCSKILKRELIKNYIKCNFLPDECNIWVGIDCTEEHRLERVVLNNKPYVYRSFLIENGYFIFPSTKIDWCNKMEIIPPRLYSMNFAHNNCGGFCVKAGLGQFKLLYEKLPERYKYHENKELEVMLKNKNLKPFLKKNINGKVEYITLKYYRENYLESNSKQLTEFELLDYGGCGCALE